PGDASVDGLDARRGLRLRRRDPGGCTREWIPHASHLADDRAPNAEGVDGAEGGRRAADRGLVAIASGALCRSGGEAGAPRAARAMDEELSRRGAVRRAGEVPRGARRARAERQPTDGG